MFLASNNHRLNNTILEHTRAFTTTSTVFTLAVEAASCVFEEWKLRQRVRNIALAVLAK